jgi:hypothetical protein
MSDYKYKIDDLATAINELSYSDMMAVSKDLCQLHYGQCTVYTHLFADLLTQWATEYKEKNAEKE